MHNTHPTSRGAGDPTARHSKKGLNVGLAAGLLGGAAAGFVFAAPGLSSAADDGAAMAAPAAIVQQTDETPADASSDVAGPKLERLRNILQPLVDDGTIDAAQADAVADHLKENRSDRQNRRGPGRFVRSEAVIDLLGMDAETLRAELREGATLADIAAEQGVSTDDLISVIVGQLEARVDAAVERGRLTADEAAEKLADVGARITAKINGDS